MKYSALIVAAGSGSRMGLGYNKLLYTFDSGETIIEKTVSIFLKDAQCTQIVLVISEEDREVFKKLFPQKDIVFTIGGDTRQESVYNGLKEVKEDHVMIHDGARPWLSQECLKRILDELSVHKACLLMVPVKDTIKEVVNGKVVQTFVRSNLRQAQTPQAFETKLIIESYEKAMRQGVVASDDAQVVELCSDEIVYEVEGSYENLKVTTIEDIRS
ncbi:MAG: 2-C-methyl-D-erythritol 4-phosphate cytidylyltransferase [Longicatena sp.]